jgi:isoquinoline 1-oxidoreductase beta subunit
MSADPKDVNAGRRHFLIGLGVVAAGTAAGIYVMPKYLAAREAGAGAGSAAAKTPPFDFKAHAFLNIASDDTITVTIGKSEMGQGVHTGLPMILAEELDVDPRRLQVQFAGVDKAFNHPFMPLQFTGGSMSSMTLYEPMRKVGATARAMLLAAAASQWKVDATTLRTDDGFVTDGRRRASYGSLAEAASAMPQPVSPALKDRKDFKYIGKPQPRLDSRLKVTGQATFGIDVDLPDMLIASVAHPPVFGAKVKGVDDSAARAVKGVVDVRQVPTGVAVYARHTWAALKGREALKIDWDLGPGVAQSTASMRTQYRKIARGPKQGTLAKNFGDVDAALKGAAKTFDIEYEMPYLAHACMEPMNATARVADGRCEMWAGTQNQSQDQNLVAAALGIAPPQVKITTVFLGGGFGRRASTNSDFMVEAALVANALGKPVPVKMVWTREDDMHAGYFRPFSINRVRGGVDADGRPVALHHVVVGQSLFDLSPLKPMIDKVGHDPSQVEGSADIPYALPNHRVETHMTQENVPTQFWRSVGHSGNGFISNTAIDELAALAGQDPYAYRRDLLAGKPRHLAVLEKVATESGWGKPLAAGHFQGIALQESFGSIVAQVVEASVADGKTVKVHRVTAAVDCGFAINPDQVVAQIQSAVVYGLSAALYGEITLDQGRVQQGNFDDYPILRLADSPAIDVHIVENGGPLGGLGEPGLPPLAPALAGAIFAATGKRIRRLPLSVSLA